MNNIRVLVTGASGYVGSHVCKELKRQGCEVLGLDRVSRPHTFQHMDHFFEMDYASPEALTMISDIVPHVIVHCAGTSLVGPSMSNPMEYYFNNVAKTAELLNHLRYMEDAPGIIFSSSASVYGRPQQAEPITEGQPFNTLSPYGTSKAMIELMLNDVSRAHGIKSVSLRYFNACGADSEHADLGQEPGAAHLIARLLEAKLKDEPFTLNGRDYDTPDGTCIRDYVHVDDLAKAHWAAIAYLLAGGDTVQLNLGSGIGHSNLDIINEVIAQVGDIEIINGPRRAGDPDRLIANISLARKLLDWEPMYSSMSEIISSSWRWYNKLP